MSQTGATRDDVSLPPGRTLHLPPRAIRRYTDEPVPDEALRDILFAATRAPSGSNRQPFRFIVLTSGEVAQEAKALIGAGARRFWEEKRAADGYDKGSGVRADSPKSRLARTMQLYVDNYESVPVVVLACFRRYRHTEYTDGASVYPACQNLLLAARDLGFGGVMTCWHFAADKELRALLAIPDDVLIMATITLGRPVWPITDRYGGGPLSELVYGERWGEAPVWAVDPDGVAHTAAGPPTGT